MVRTYNAQVMCTMKTFEKENTTSFLLCLSANLHVHVTLAQCTLVSSSCHRNTHTHTNAFALAHVAPQDRFPLHMVAEPS